MANKTKINNTQKVAMLLIALGTEHSAKILKNMREDEIEKISIELSRIKYIDQDTKKEILKEYHDVITAGKSFSEGGTDYCNELLTKTLGKNEASAVIGKLKEELESKPFTITRNVSAKQLLNILQHENSQVIALVLSYVDPSKAAEVLQSLPELVQLDVAKKIALMSKYSSDYVQEIEKFLSSRISSYASSEEDVEIGGSKGLAAILNKVQRSTERSVIEFLQYTNQDLAKNVKEHLFTFDDIATMLDKQSLTKVVSKISNKEWGLALKSSYPGVAEAIFSACSERQKALILEEQSMLGQQKISEIEKIQKHIVETIRVMEESGDIIISRDGDTLV